MQFNVVKMWVGVGAFAFAEATSMAIASLPLAASEAVAKTDDSALTVISAEAKTPTSPSAQGSGGGEAQPAFQDKLSGAQLVNALRQGGYVIYFRHAQTEKDYADQVSAVMGKCDTQRMLSEEGWKQSKMIGQGFQALKIPVGTVYSSEYCRAWQTADLAFGRYQKTAALNFPKSAEYTDTQKAQMRAALMPMLIAPPAASMNTVIVGHDDLFDAVVGIYPEPQGIAYIVKAQPGGKLDVVANVEAGEWLQLPRY